MIKIGICDDIPILREIIASYVRVYEEKNGTNFEIFQYSSGEELVAEYAEGKFFDLLFLDQHMKKLTGLETAREIRRYQSSALCDIVFVTSSENQYPFPSVQPLRILKKPVLMMDVAGILEEVMSEMREMREPR